MLQWGRPDVLAELEPSKLAAAGTWTREHIHGMVAESFLWGMVERFWGGKMAPWALLSEQRYEIRPDQLWHCCDSDHRYRQVAAEYGVELGDEAVGVKG